MMTTVHSTRMQYGRASVITTTTAISHDPYVDCFSGMTIHSGTPLYNTEPIVHRGNAPSMKQSSVSRTMTRRTRPVVDHVATLCGWTTAITRSTVIATVIHADNSLKLPNEYIYIRKLQPLAIS